MNWELHWIDTVHYLLIRSSTNDSFFVDIWTTKGSSKLLKTYYISFVQTKDLTDSSRIDYNYGFRTFMAPNGGIETGNKFLVGIRYGYCKSNPNMTLREYVQLSNNAANKNNLCLNILLYRFYFGQ